VKIKQAGLDVFPVKGYTKPVADLLWFGEMLLAGLGVAALDPVFCLALCDLHLAFYD
jgi:hypothetical protein